MIWEDKLKELLPSAERDTELKPYCSIGVGGVCDFIYKTETINDLMRTVSAARSVGAPYKIIGNGTDIILSDSGFEGLIIINKTSNLSVDVASGRVIADSGVPLARFILEAASKGLGGLEPLFGIPGTVGGAIAVNAGAHAVSVGQFLKSSSVMVSSQKIMNVKADWFKFGYRQSKLKYSQSSSPPVVLNAIFQLQHRKNDDALRDIANYKKWREEHQPLGEKTCGSIFKNPINSDNAQTESEKFRTAGYLLDTSGAKKMSVGDARVSKIHANWVVNRSSASACDVRKLIEKMRAAVEEKYSLTLREEIEYLGDWSSCQNVKS